VHRDIDGHKIGSAQHLRVEAFDRQVEAIDDDTFGLQQRRRFRETERLATDFVRIYQNHFQWGNPDALPG
jgi:hypothetical protein